MSEPNEIDWMYFRFAFENRGKEFDSETVEAVNDSIDKIIISMNEGLKELEKLGDPFN